MTEAFELTFHVPFVAAKQRPRLTKAGRAYTPKATHDAESRIWCAYRAACTDAGHDGAVCAPAGMPVAVTVVAHQRPPRTGARRGPTPWVTRPDIDNVTKLVLDALNPVTKVRDGARVVVRGGAWADDSQVVRLVGVKAPRVDGVGESTQVTVTWPCETIGGTDE